MAKGYMASLYTRGRIEVNVNKLIELFGHESPDNPQPDVPPGAMKAELIFEPEDVVKVVWTCLATKALIEKIAPELLQQEADAMKKYEGFKRYEPFMR